MNSEYRFYADSLYGVVKVEGNILFVDGKEQGSFDYPEDNSARMMANYALDPLKNETAILNIGLGWGLTLTRILEKTEALVDVVEINPVIVQVNREFTDVLEDERVNLIIDDGLNYLKETKKKYDSILVDVGDPTVPHSSCFYTVEVFKIIGEVLSENGIFALWEYNGRGRYLDILHYSLKEAFSFVYHLPEVFLASHQKLGLPECTFSGPYEINTLNKDTLTEPYLEYWK